MARGMRGTHNSLAGFGKRGGGTVSYRGAMHRGVATGMGRGRGRRR